MLTIKGCEEGLTLCFKENVSLQTAKELLLKIKNDNDTFFRSGKMNVSYSGTDFKYNEEIIFSKYIRELFGDGASLIKKHQLNTEQIEYSLFENERMLLVVNKSLRSGESVLSRGDIIIYGDVNPGAKVEAKGNITVLGALRGSAHISDKGRVFALKMNPEQIRIGKVYSYNKTDEFVENAYALEENGEIILQSL